MEARTEAILHRIPEGVKVYGAEIGVYLAENAASLLEHRPLLTLMCVDCWEPYPQIANYNDPMLHDRDWNAIKAEARSRLSLYNDRVIIMEMKSAEASRLIADKSLDVLFVDSLHKDPWISQDIELWFPKVKQGGLFGGHDYRQNQFPDVCRAVNRLATLYAVDFGPDSTWFVTL